VNTVTGSTTRAAAESPVSGFPHFQFDHQPRTRLVFGLNAVEQIGVLARDTGLQRALVVTDPGIVAAGHAARVIRLLEEAGVHAVVFDQVRQNPTTRDVAECLAAARSGRIDGFIGLGGGSSMDTAKGCNFILTNGGEMRDYWGMAKALRPMLPLIAVPTTAGTGSECQSFALIADEETHQKMACGDPKAAARVAILDPALTVSQPVGVTACTGVDAIAHAVETAVTLKRNPLSLMYSHEAFKLCVTSFGRVLERPDDIEARGRMLLGSAFAGMAIENSMLGAAHSAANPLTAHYGIIHGQAVGLMLPAVIRFNGRDEAARKAYAELASAPEIACVRDGLDFAMEALVARIEGLLNLAKIPRSLRECGVDKEKIPVLAGEAARQWTATFNPRPLGAADFEALYLEAWEDRGNGDR
jgi:alcohol dehydrogenase